MIYTETQKFKPTSVSQNEPKHSKTDTAIIRRKKGLVNWEDGTALKWRHINNKNKNLLHLYSTFLGTQSALHQRGESSQQPPMCSIHLDDATAAILCQDAHRTPAYWWREDRVIKPIRVWGWLGGHDSQTANGQIWPGSHSYTPTLFEGHPGIFLWPQRARTSI